MNRDNKYLIVDALDWLLMLFMRIIDKIDKKLNKHSR